MDGAFPIELAAAALAVCGCLLLARRGRVGRQVDAWLDAAVLGIAGGILAWEVILAPAVDRQAIHLTPGTLALLAAEVVVGMLVVLVLINPPAPRRISVLYLAILALLVSWIASSIVELPDPWLVPWLQAAWLLGFPASAALALHPAAIHPPAPPEPRDDAVEHVNADRARLFVLGVSLAAAPAAFAIDAVAHAAGREDHVAQTLVLAFAALTTNTLVILRIANLVRRLRLDVRGRARAEAASRRSEALANALVEQSPVGIQVFDRDGTSTGLNVAMRQILALPDGATGTGTVNVLTDEAVAASPFADPIRRAFAGETAVVPPQPFDRSLLAKAGTGGVIHVRQTLFPVKDPGGDVIRVISFMEDVTAQVAADAARRELGKRLQETAKLEALGVLAGGIAHDFNNLLVAILGHASMARAELPADSDAAQDLVAVENAAQRAADLARQMLAYSGRGPFVVAPVSLELLLTETADLLGRSIAKNAELTFDFAPHLPSVLADATELRQVALNLIVNASDSLAGRPGKIGLRTAMIKLERNDPAVVPGLDPEPGLYVALEVSDTGVGLDRATLGRIFEPFFTTKEPGRGLGLSATLGIIRGHQGAIRVTSVPGEGTAFQILLPPTEAVAAPVADPGVRPHVRPAGRILVVDDEASVRRLNRRVLEQAGFEVVEADDGPPAIEAFATDPAAFHAVVLDVTLPTLDGLTVLSRIREIRGDVPVVLSSGWSHEEVAARLNHSVGVRFLQKPYRAEALVDAVR
jgi:signal transduction histidine kinase/CheY-like chemotaxis protein